MTDIQKKDVLTFVVTLDKRKQRLDLQNQFIVRFVPEILTRFGSRAEHFYFMRHWVSGDPYGCSVWLRFKANMEILDQLQADVLAYLKDLESRRHVEQVWEPKVESEVEVFGSAPGMGPAEAYGSLWCFLDGTTRTALNLLLLGNWGQLDVPEWVIADLWVHHFYNALGIPDFEDCPACQSAQCLRVPRCHACGYELEVPNHAVRRGT